MAPLPRGRSAPGLRVAPVPVTGQRCVPFRFLTQNDLGNDWVLANGFPEPRHTHRASKALELETWGTPIIIFYLGTHKAHWLKAAKFPLFISRRRLIRNRKHLYRAVCNWALDSGGFTELNQYGQWTITPSQYVQELRRYNSEIGNLDWAATMDWMCEPQVLQITGKTITEHQRRTIDRFVELRSLCPEIPIIPVLQGWSEDDYLRCVDLYFDAGIDLTAESTVGIGSVCRRQHTTEAEEIIRRIAHLGIRLHGFGLKISGLRRTHQLLLSADSMAWSFAARMSTHVYRAASIKLAITVCDSQPNGGTK